MCLLNDYVSSRLQIRVDEEDCSTLKHVNMIYCRLVDLSVFTQILVESNLKVGSQESLNDELISESGSFNTEKNLVFELPNFLAKYYLV